MSQNLTWKISKEPVPYDQALESMKAHVDKMIKGEAPETIWLLEHPPVYTAGTSAQEQDLLDTERFDVYKVGRGGEYTYHGPGQRIAYIMLDLKKRKLQDLHAYIHLLEECIIQTLAHFNITGERRKGRIGIWVCDDNNEDKIAAIGVRVRKWVTFHGVAINVNPDLSHFEGIVPCGIKEYGVTSLEKLNRSDINYTQLDEVFQQKLELLLANSRT
jgi:lipoyl(octanoyl) transferase